MRDLFSLQIAKKHVDHALRLRDRDHRAERMDRAGRRSGGRSDGRIAASRGRRVRFERFVRGVAIRSWERHAWTVRTLTTRRKVSSVDSLCRSTSPPEAPATRATGRYTQNVVPDAGLDITSRRPPI